VGSKQFAAAATAAGGGRRNVGAAAAQFFLLAVWQRGPEDRGRFTVRLRRGHRFHERCFDVVVVG
jgi:hypothetical protein